MHPIELYQRYLKARRNSNIPDLELHPEFTFFSQSMYQDQNKWMLVCLFLYVNDPLSGPEIINPENVEKKDITQFLKIDPSEFRYEFSYCCPESFDINDLDISSERWMKNVDCSDSLIVSLLEKIATIDIIQRANKALAEKGIYIDILGVSYFLSSGEDYENSCSIDLYEAVDPNGVSYWLCNTSLMFVATERGDDEFIMLLQPAVLEKFVFGDKK